MEFAHNGGPELEEIFARPLSLSPLGNTSRATTEGRHGRVSHDAGESVILLSYPATELSEESESRYLWQPSSARRLLLAPSRQFLAPK